jgi:hypothetical protein
MNNPFGVGYGNGLMYVNSSNAYWDAHNLLFSQYISAGFMTVSAILYIFGSTILKIKKYKSRLNDKQKGIVDSLLLSLFGLFIYGTLSGGEFVGSSVLSGLVINSFMINILLVRYILKVAIQRSTTIKQDLVDSN